MVRATADDKPLITELLSGSFRDNKSVNYIVKQDAKRAQCLRYLMDYSFDLCRLFGDVFLSEDRKACALVILPEKRILTLESVLLDGKLIASTTGLGNAAKAMRRESRIKKAHPDGLLYHLWFIGVIRPNKGRASGVNC